MQVSWLTGPLRPGVVSVATSAQPPRKLEVRPVALPQRLRDAPDLAFSLLALRLLTTMEGVRAAIQQNGTLTEGLHYTSITLAAPSISVDSSPPGFQALTIFECALSLIGFIALRKEGKPTCTKTPDQHVV